MDKSRLTQMTRTAPSRPTRWLLETRTVENKTVLHHGRGKAFVDSVAMWEAGAVVTEYDPNVPGIDDPDVLHQHYDVVVSNFVLNVLPPVERDRVLDEIMRAVKFGGVAYIAVRTDKVNGTPVEDGVLTSRGTFQAQLDAAGWTYFFGCIPIRVDSGYALYAIQKHVDTHYTY